MYPKVGEKKHTVWGRLYGGVYGVSGVLLKFMKFVEVFVAIISRILGEVSFETVSVDSMLEFSLNIVLDF